MARKRKNTEINKTSAELASEALIRYKPLLSEEEFIELEKSLAQPLYSALRFNPLKVDPQTAILELSQRYGWKVRPVPYCPTGWWITESQIPISQTLEHRLGHYYIQDAASMMPVELFDFDNISSPLVLDMAASPGGKTTHLLSRIRDRGLVIANDASRDRVTALRMVLQTWGALHVAVTSFPGEKFGYWFPEKFDRILLDAPCSMQNLRGTESHPMRAITEKEQKQLSRRQERLLANAVQALKVGGQAVYATCTLSPEEDEAVLDAVLRSFSGAVQIENLEARIPLPAPALVTDGTHQFDPSLKNAARLWPHRYDTSGFFCALITKTAPVSGPVEAPPQRSLEKIELRELSDRDLKVLSDLFESEYAFNLDQILDEHELSLWKRRDKIYALPELFLTHFSSFPFQAVGLLLGSETVDGFEPSQEWISRFHDRFQSGIFQLPSENVEKWLRGEDILGDFSQIYERGKILIIQDEFNRLLGPGRVLNDRLKNLLPRRMVYT